MGGGARGRAARALREPGRGVRTRGGTAHSQELRATRLRVSGSISEQAPPASPLRLGRDSGRCPSKHLLSEPRDFPSLLKLQFIQDCQSERWGTHPQGWRRVVPPWPRATFQAPHLLSKYKLRGPPGGPTCLRTRTPSWGQRPQERAAVNPAGPTPTHSLLHLTHFTGSRAPGTGASSPWSRLAPPLSARLCQWGRYRDCHRLLGAAPPPRAVLGGPGFSTGPA